MCVCVLIWSSTDQRNVDTKGRKERGGVRITHVTGTERKRYLSRVGRGGEESKGTATMDDHIKS